MSGVIKRITGGDLAQVYEAVDANLSAAKLVVSSTTHGEFWPNLQGIKVAGNTALDVLGVSAKDAVTAANRPALESSTSTDPTASNILTIGIPSSEVTVYNDCIALLTYTAVAVPYGAKLAAAAAGAVRAWVAGDGAAAIVGWCAQPGGVGAGGGLALARIHV